MPRHPFRLCEQQNNDRNSPLVGHVRRRNNDRVGRDAARGQGNAEAVERRDRAWQRTHWARQTALASHPNTCPPDVIAWLSQPLVPPDRATTLSLLSFQRCAAALGHDPAQA